MDRLRGGEEMRKKRGLTGAALVLALIALQCLWAAQPGSAQEANGFPVTLTVLSPAASDTRTFEAELFIRFSDRTYDSGSLYASYHLFPTAERGSSQESLRFDAPVRMPIHLDANGEAVVRIPVDTSELDMAEFFVQYDIVDEATPRWLGYLPGVMNPDPQTLVRYNPWAELLQPLKNAWEEGPVLFVINGITFAAAIWAIVIIKRKRLIDF